MSTTFFLPAFTRLVIAPSINNLRKSIHQAMKRCFQQACLNATPPLASSSRTCTLHHIPPLGPLSTRRYSQQLPYTDSPGSRASDDAAHLFAARKVTQREDNVISTEATKGGRPRSGKGSSRRPSKPSPRPGGASRTEDTSWVRSVVTAPTTERRDFRKQARKQGRPAPARKVGVQMSRLSSQDVEDNKNALLDIYNYCARLGFLPTVNVDLVKASSRYFHFTIELPDRNIRASANSRKLVAAEVDACLNVKKQLEKLHAEGSTDDLAVEGSTALTTTNAKEFIKFYKSLRRDASFSLHCQNFSPGALHGHLELNGDALGGRFCVRTGGNGKVVEELAYIVAAMNLAASDSSLMPRFRTALEEGQGSFLPPARAVHWEISPKTVSKLDSVLRDVQRMGLPKAKVNHSDRKDVQVPATLREEIGLQEHQLAAKNADLKRRLEVYRTDPELIEQRALRDSLPMSQHRESVLRHINDNLYSVIVGATGSGKTTQVPQILLEDAIDNDIGAACNIVCTQPRRIAATSVASRVAAERGERLRSSVGYHVRFDPRLPQAGGSITYCTTGILLQRLQKFPDQVLDSLTHIIIDEVHERDIIIDFLMVTLKKMIPTRRAAGKPVPKVVLMSATIDSKLFATYFKETTADGVTHNCPSLSIPGRTFPVKERYFEDIVDELDKTAAAEFQTIMRGDKDTAAYMLWENHMSKSSGVQSKSDDSEAVIDWNKLATVDGQSVDEKQDSTVPISLVVATVAQIAKTTNEGAILVFLPGFEEIKKVKLALTQTTPMGIDFLNESQYKLSTLHSSVPAAEQAAVFQSVPAGCRKIILSTNIAETSVTIPDIQHVVDTGKLREKRYDQVRGITKLQCTWISKSNAKQRAGRAGRVQNGNYYALYSRARYESFRAIGLPEMLRSDLQEVCLDIKAQAFKTPIRDFLAASIEAPAPEAVNASVLRLIEMQALTETEDITPLGKLLASLPTHPALGKMIILGVIFRCLDPMVILGASMNERSIFLAPPDKKREARQAQSQFIDPNAPTDHLASITAFMQMRQILTTRNDWDMVGFANRNFIHIGAFRTIHSTTKQIEQVLEDAGLLERHAEHQPRVQIGSAELNTHSRNLNLIKALIVAGLHPNLAIPMGTTYRTKREMYAMIHPSSFNFTGYKDRARKNDLVSFSSLIKSSDGQNTLLRDTTPVSTLAAILFGGGLAQKGREVTLDKWLTIFGGGGTYGSVDKVVTFRHVLDLLLGTAFADLAHLKHNKIATEHTGNEQGEPGNRMKDYLKYDRVRDVFTDGLVDALDLDAADAAAAASGNSPGGQSSSRPRYGDSGINSRSRALNFGKYGNSNSGSSSGSNTGLRKLWDNHGDSSDNGETNGHGEDRNRGRSSIFGPRPTVTETMGRMAASRARRGY